MQKFQRVRDLAALVGSSCLTLLPVMGQINVAGSWSIIDFGTADSLIVDTDPNFGGTSSFFDGNEFDLVDVQVNADGTLSSDGETGRWFLFDESIVVRSNSEPETFTARLSPDGTKIVNASWELIPYPPVGFQGTATYRPVYLTLGVREAAAAPTFPDVVNSRWIRLEQTIRSFLVPGTFGPFDQFGDVEHSVDQIDISNQSSFTATLLMATGDPQDVGQTLTGQLINLAGRPGFDVGGEVIPFPTLNASGDLALSPSSESSPSSEHGGSTRIENSVELFIMLPTTLLAEDIIGRWYGSSATQLTNGDPFTDGFVETWASNFVADFLPSGVLQLRTLNGSPFAELENETFLWSIQGDRLLIDTGDGTATIYPSANKDFLAFLDNDLGGFRDEFVFGALVRGNGEAGLAALTRASVTIPSAGGNPVVGVTSQLGYSYQLQRSATLGGAWSDVGPLIPGTGSTVSTTDALPLPERGFYRWSVIPDLP